METELKEIKEVILSRVPPGDRWVFTNQPITKVSQSGPKVFQSLTEALEGYYQIYGNTRFYIDARKGTVEIVKDETIEKPIQKFSIYGED